MIKKLHYHRFELDSFKTDLNINDFGRVNLMAGLNGVGKTLVLETIWFLNHLQSVYQVLLYTKTENPDQELRDYIEEVSEYFFDADNINGGFEIVSDSMRFRIQYKDNVLDNFDVQILDRSFNVKKIKAANLITDTAKDWKNYERFLKLQKSFGIDFVNGINEIRLFRDYFRLPDIEYFSRLQYLLSQIKKAGNSFNLDFIHDKFGSSIIEPGCTLYIKRGVPYINNRGDIKKFSKLSSGTCTLISTVLFWLPCNELQNYLKGNENT